MFVWSYVKSSKVEDLKEFINLICEDLECTYSIDTKYCKRGDFYAIELHIPEGQLKDLENHDLRVSVTRFTDWCNYKAEEGE